LRKALFKTVEEVKAPPPPVVQDPGKAELKAPASVSAGATFPVQWKGPNSRGDYITITEKSSKDLEYADYVYTKRANPANFTAPGKTGDYQLRYVHGQNKKVIGRADIKVTPVLATVEAPESAEIATVFSVKWQGPAYQSDYVSIARSDQDPGGYINYTYTNAGSPLKLQAPSDPGLYEVRYIMGKGNVLLAKTTIQIKGVTASVQAPVAADMAAKFAVSWQGPNNRSDYISIAKADEVPGSYVYYTYTNAGSTLKLQAPSEPGTYEVRYILGQDNKLLAKTTIDIKPVAAKVTPPSAAAADTQFTVPWQGPGYSSDYITIARADQSEAEYIMYSYTRTGNPVKMKAPKEPGTYEVRYILGNGNKMLHKATITVK
jgi:Ca-activated chloride channel homolog